MYVASMAPTAKTAAATVSGGSLRWLDSVSLRRRIGRLPCFMGIKA